VALSIINSRSSFQSPSSPDVETGDKSADFCFDSSCGTGAGVETGCGAGAGSGVGSVAWGCGSGSGTTNTANSGCATVSLAGMVVSSELDVDTAVSIVVAGGKGVLIGAPSRVDAKIKPAPVTRKIPIIRAILLGILMVVTD